MIILRCPSMPTGAVSLKKSHDIVILSFCNIVKSQTNYLGYFISHVPVFSNCQKICKFLKCTNFMCQFSVLLKKSDHDPIKN